MSAPAVRPEIGFNLRRRPLDLDQLQTFQVVAHSGSFTKAARELGSCQSNVTTRIKALERVLGVRLFNRRRFSKEIALTQAGECVLAPTDKLLALLREMQDSVRGAKAR